MIRTSLVLVGAVLAALVSTTAANFAAEGLLAGHVDYPLLLLRVSILIGAMIAVPTVAMHMAIRYTSSESVLSLFALTLIVGTGMASLIALIVSVQIGQIVSAFLLYMLATGVLNSLCAWLVLYYFLETGNKNGSL